jgi:zinc protease
VNVTEWTLSNGARVLVKPTDFKADEVLLNAYSWGGTSLVSDADYQSASNATAIIRNSGVGTFSAVDLGKKLAGKSVSVNAGIGPTTETLSGQASPKDLETMFQLINLRFTAPRLDTAAWLAMRGQMEANLANRNASPFTSFIDTLNSLIASHHPRANPPTAASLAEINPRRALEIYKERFANAGDFTFVFVGSVSLDSMKPLVEKYIASLPGTPAKEKYKELADTEPKTIIEKTVRKGAAPQAMSVVGFTGPFNYSPQARFEMLALTTLAQSRVIESLREEMGATYSPNFGGAGRSNPHKDYRITAQYTSSPDNVEKLAARVLKVADSLRNYPPSEADVQKVKEQLLRTRETSLKTNDYWAGNIGARDQNGEDIAGLLGPYDDMIKNLTAKQIQDAAKLYLNPKSYFKVVLLPEGIKP